MAGFRRPGRLRHILLITAYGIAGVGLGIFLGWLALRQVDLRDIGQVLSDINIFAFILAFTTMLVAAYLRGVRWRILLFDEPISTKRLFFIEQTGTALDTLSVVHLLDEVVQVGILTVRDRIAVAKVLATLAMQRTLEFGSISLVLSGGALLLTPMRPYWPYLVTAMGLSIAALIALFIIGPALKHLWLISRFKIVHGFGDAVGVLRAQPSRAWRAFGLSVLQSVLIGTAGWLLAFGLGLELSLLAMIVVTLGVLFFGSFVPGLPMAFGTFEFAAVTLLSLWGVTAADAIGFTLALRAIVYLPPLIVATAFLPTEGLHTLPAMRRLLAEAANHR